MSRYLWSALTVVTAALAPATAAAQTDSPNPDRAAVQAVIVSLANHIQDSNLGAIESLFPARGLHILTDDATTHGWPEYRDQHLRPELEQYQNLRYAHTSVEPTVRGDIAWVTFRRQLEGNTASGAAQVQGRGSAVLEKRDGRWMIVQLHMSR